MLQTFVKDPSSTINYLQKNYKNLPILILFCCFLSSTLRIGLTNWRPNLWTSLFALLLGSLEDLQEFSLFDPTHQGGLWPRRSQGALQNLQPSRGEGRLIDDRFHPKSTNRSSKAGVQGQNRPRACWLNGPFIWIKAKKHVEMDQTVWNPPLF